YFSIDKQFDDEYVIVPLRFAENLRNYGNKRTALEIKVADGYNIAKVKQALKAQLGPDFLVRDTEEQHASLLLTIKLEKLFVFLTLTLNLAVASYNNYESLEMLEIDKKEDIAVLIDKGTIEKHIRSSYIKQGAIIAFTGAVEGLSLGYAV